MNGAFASSMAAPELGSEAIAWQLLRWLNVARAIVAGLLITLFFGGALIGGIGALAPALFVWTAIVWFGFSVFASFAVENRRPNPSSQTALQLAGDIAAIALLTFTSGGAGSGLAELLVASIAAGALIFSLRLALAFAALATLAILVQESFAALTLGTEPGGWVETGILGIVLFAIAALSNRLAERLRQSELINAQRGLDLANLATLNEYIIQHLASGVVVIDGDDNVRLANPAAASALGLVATASGEMPLSVAAPRLKTLLDAWRGAPFAHRDTTLTTPDNTIFIPHFNQLGPTPAAGTLAFLEDASNAAEQVRQIKLAGLGRLTASIAHEIRNPLGAIGHANQLLAESDALPDGDRRLVEIIHEHTGRVNGIVENVLRLSRGGAGKIQTLSLDPWLREFAAEFRDRHALGEDDLRLTVHQGRASLAARVDASQLRQVIDNLAENALRHGVPETAMRYGDHAVLEIRLGIRPFRDQPSIEILDRGAGIGSDAREQIFEPFYTSSSHGTGLGLFIARELCECNNAALTYHERGGGGSCFRITFTRSEKWIA
jgi:two-component system sensor histidine kinase PilS (NtrC family)